MCETNNSIIREFAHLLWNVECVKEYVNRWRSQSRDAKLGKSGTKKLKFGSLWSFFDSAYFVFFGYTFGTLTIFWFYFLFWFLRWFARKCLELEAIFKISDYFFLLFYFFFVSEKNVFGPKSKNLLTNLFSQSVIRSAHFCTETDYWFTVTFTDLGNYFHHSQLTTNARTLYFKSVVKVCIAQILY